MPLTEIQRKPIQFSGRCCRDNLPWIIDFRKSPKYRFQTWRLGKLENATEIFIRNVWNKFIFSVSWIFGEIRLEPFTSSLKSNGDRLVLQSSFALEDAYFQGSWCGRNESFRTNRILVEWLLFGKIRKPLPLLLIAVSRTVSTGAAKLNLILFSCKKSSWLCYRMSVQPFERCRPIPVSFRHLWTCSCWTAASRLSTYVRPANQTDPNWSDI